MAGALEGLVVLDLTRVLAGPFCTMLLRDLGAEVVKVEHPEGGDLARGTAPFVEDESYYFLSVNRGKKSVTLDLSNSDAKDLFKRMVARADVVVENFRPGVMQRLGLDYTVLNQINPRIVYAAIAGFGQDGPYAHRPSLDVIVQAMGGIMSITGEAGGGPVRVGSSMGDITAGLFAAVGILAALEERHRSGAGQFVDIGMMDCQVAILENAVGRYILSGEVPKPLGTRHPSFTPFQAYLAQDGWFVVAIVGGLNDMWPRLCAAIDRVDLIDDPRFVDGHSRTLHYDELNPMLEEAFRKKTVAQWLAELEDLGIPCGPVNTIDKVVHDPQVKHRNMLVDVERHGGKTVTVVNSPIKMSRTPGYARGASPDLGQHNGWLLNDMLGLSGAETARLKETGALGKGE